MARIVIKPNKVFLGNFGDDPTWSPNGEPLEKSLVVCGLEDVALIDAKVGGGDDDADVLVDDVIDAVEVEAWKGVGMVFKSSVDPGDLVGSSDGEGPKSAKE